MFCLKLTVYYEYLFPSVYEQNETKCTFSRCNENRCNCEWQVCRILLHLLLLSLETVFFVCANGYIAFVVGGSGSGSGSDIVTTCIAALQFTFGFYLAVTRKRHALFAQRTCFNFCIYYLPNAYYKHRKKSNISANALLQFERDKKTRVKSYSID